MRTLILLFLSVMVLCCSVTTLTIPHPSKVATRPRNIRVFCFDRSFPVYQTGDYVEGIKRELPRLGILPVVRVGVNGNNGCNLLIKNWNNQDLTSHVIGLCHRRSNVVFIDHSRVFPRPPNTRQAIVLHEIGHWLGLDHICPDGSTQRFIEQNHCSTTITGSGIMNPVLFDYHFQFFTESDFRNIYNH